MKKEVNSIVVFPAPVSHRLDAGGVGGVEIKHIHPEYPSQEERLERLKDVKRTCAALVTRQRAKTARRERSA